MNQQKTILTKEQFKRYKNSIKKNRSGIGIPQGSPVSAILSNVYMLSFDKKMHTYVMSYGGKYLRYSDDFFIVLPYVNETEIQKHKQFLDISVAEVDNLALQPDKTAIYTYENGSIFEYPRNTPAKNRLSRIHFFSGWR